MHIHGDALIEPIIESVIKLKRVYLSLSLEEEEEEEDMMEEPYGFQKV